MSPGEIAETLELLGFEFDGRTDHPFMKNAKTGARVKIPNDHGSKIGHDTWLFSSILRQAGVTKKEFAAAYFGDRGSSRQRVPRG
jgi:predicted RNA binding protein YcfA (HicA-like mRNA interferase family)